MIGNDRKSSEKCSKVMHLAFAIGEKEGAGDMGRGEGSRNDFRSWGLPILGRRKRPRAHGPGRGAAKGFSLRALDFVVVVVLGRVKRKLVGNDGQ